MSFYRLSITELASTLEVARLLSVSRSGISNILAKRAEPTGSQTLKILEILASNRRKRL